MFQTFKRVRFSVFIAILLLPALAKAQDTAADSLLQNATLDRVVQYAIVHQPQVQQSLIDQEIIDKTIKGKLADWYPQINFAYNYQRNIDLQTSIIGGNPIRFGVYNTSYAQVNGTQVIFNRDVLLANSTASKVRVQSEQVTARTKIDAVVNTTKAFYDVLATSQQIKVSEEIITRLQRSLKDAQSQYNAGLTDKTDYKRAMISLGNAVASLKSNRELLTYKIEYLKTLMGYPVKGDLQIVYDTLQMEKEIGFDTLQTADYNSRIEFRLLTTQRELQKANVKYSYWGFIPTLNAYGSYILNYQNNNFSDLYAQQYKNSFVGATFTLPLFQGMKRTAKIQEQKLTLERLDKDVDNLRSNLNTDYIRALAAYKSNLATYLALKDNVDLAREVYDVIQLQYKNGVKTYLDVTIAEADLRTTRINYFNALYMVLSSKLDTQKSLGQITY